MTSRIVLTPGGDLSDMIECYAEAKGLEPREAAEDLIRLGLSSLGLKGAPFTRIEAEIELMDYVDSVVPEIGPGIPPDATAQVFKRIEGERLALYATAIGGDPYARGNHERARINRRIGRRTKDRLGADAARYPDGETRMAYTPPGVRSLITGYTVLGPRLQAA